jgi:peroxiredoxin
MHPKALAHRRRSRTPALWLAGLVLAALALLGPIAGHAAGKLVPGSGEPAPPLVARDIDGREINLASFRGRTVVVNFWATWCAPCVAEMPSLSRLRERLQPLGLEVIGVNFQENAARIRPFAERLGIDFPLVRDHDGSIRSDWGVRVFPTTFIIGPDQRIAAVAVGEIDWEAHDIERVVRGILGAPGNRPARERT